MPEGSAPGPACSRATPRPAMDSVAPSPGSVGGSSGELRARAKRSLTLSVCSQPANEAQHRMQSTPIRWGGSTILASDSGVEGPNAKSLAAGSARPESGGHAAGGPSQVQAPRPVALRRRLSSRRRRTRLGPPHPWLAPRPGARISATGPRSVSPPPDPYGSPRRSVAGRSRAYRAGCAILLSAGRRPRHRSRIDR